MPNCEIPSCRRELSKFSPTEKRPDGIIIEVLNTGRGYLICNDWAKKFGFIK